LEHKLLYKVTYNIYKNMKCIREFSKSPIPKKHFLVSHPINVSIMVYQLYKNERKRPYLILSLSSK